MVGLTPEERFCFVRFFNGRNGGAKKMRHQKFADSSESNVIIIERMKMVVLSV